MIVFPTSDTERCTLGTPLRAKACRCPKPLVDDEGGCFCGFWTEATIHATWSRQAKKMAQGCYSTARRYPASAESLLTVPPELAGVAL